MKKSTLLILLIGLPLFSFAQDEVKAESETSSKYQVMTNKFWNNWFITAGGGAQVMFGDDDEKGDFGKRISPAVNVGVGKWFTPGLGLRLQYSGLSVKGFGFSNGGYIEGTPDSKGLYKEKWNYMNLHADIMFNLTNMFCGYKEDRVYNAIPYLGFGFIHRFDEDRYGDKKFFLGGNVGLINRFRLSKAWDFNIEANALLLKDDFDSKQEGTKLDAVVSVTAGFTYKFKQRGFKSAPAPITTGITAAEMQAIQDRLNEQIAKNRELEQALINEKNKKAEVVEKVVAPSPRVIFFTINKADITPKDKVNLQYVAEQIKQSSGKVFTIVGYADQATGTPEFNQQLSQRRAENVYNTLINDFGVSSSQLKVEAKGGVPNMYGASDLNRVVIVE